MLYKTNERRVRMNNILNIINFVRASEPRAEDDSFLLETFKREVELCARYDFPSTFLFQYDALILPEYTDYIKTVLPTGETGLWLETVGQLVKKCGIEWRGRNDWDWHNDVGFLIGYTPREREKLIDEAFSEYKKVFGEHPKSVGSWHIDAYSLNYIAEKYSVNAACICKEQTGTDGYTLWGGVYSGAYFPSVNNMLCPASSEKNKINIPVFRMLGSDPVAQYDNGIESESKAQGVESLEPVYPDSGGSERWVRGFFDNNYNGKSLALAYAQAGQENSFGCDIFNALPMQFEVFEELRAAGKIKIEALGESGRRFSSMFSLTPPQSQCFDYAPDGSDSKTMWYNSSKYRINIHLRNGVLYIRDLHIFDERMKEAYLTERVTSHKCGYYTLPVTDGLNFSGKNERAGIYFCGENGKPFTGGEWNTHTNGKDSVTVESNGFSVAASPNEVKITAEFDYKLCFVGRYDVIKTVSERELSLSFNGFDYVFRIKNGIFSKKENGETEIIPENKCVIFDIKQ